MLELIRTMCNEYNRDLDAVFRPTTWAIFEKYADENGLQIPAELKVIGASVCLSGEVPLGELKGADEDDDAIAVMWIGFEKMIAGRETFKSILIADRVRAIQQGVVIGLPGSVQQIAVAMENWVRFTQTSPFDYYVNLAPNSEVFGSVYEVDGTLSHIKFVSGDMRSFIETLDFYPDDE